MVTGMRTARILVATALSLAGLAAVHGPARADTARAWAAARAGLPADAHFVFGLDIAALQKTQLFATYFPMLRDKPDTAKVLDAVRDLCKLDPVAIVQGVVVGMSSDQSEGAAYVALKGLDRTKVSACLQQIMQSGKSDLKVSVKQDGDVTVISHGSDSHFVGWAGKDVVVVALHPEDRPALARWMGGKGALGKTGIGKTLGKVNTAAEIWGAGEGQRELEPGITLAGGYGTVGYAKGNLAADVHAVLGNADQATKEAGAINQQLDQARQGTQLPAELSAVAKAVTVSAESDQLHIKANLRERDLLRALEVVFGGHKP
jgi:hypothetical protein